MQSSRSFSLIFVLLFSMSFVGTYVGAVENTRIVRVGAFSLKPLNFIDQGGQAAGLYPDIIRRVAAAQGWQLEFVQGDWATCLSRLQRGEIDLMTTIAFTPERAEIMNYSSVAVCDIWGQAFMRPGENLSGIRDLDGASIGIMRQDINGANFIALSKRLGLQVTIKEYANYDQVFSAVAAGEIVAGIAAQHYGLRNASSYKLVASTIQFSPFSVFFASKKNTNADILQALDKELTIQKADPSSYYYQRLGFWMGAESMERTIVPRWLLVGVALVVMAALFLFITNRLLNVRVRQRTLELGEQEQAYRNLVESANCAIVRLDAQAHIKYINPYGIELFGYSSEELLGRHVIGTIISEVDSSGHDVSQMVEGAFSDPEKFKTNENENICKDGSRIFVQWSNHASYDENGNLVEMLSIGIDVSAQRQLENDLQHARKMEALGTLTGGVAHDFNNMLAGIIAAADLLRLKAVPGQEAYLNMIIKSSDRAAALIRQMLSFARKGGLALTAIELAPVVQDAVELLKPSIHKKIAIVVDYVESVDHMDSAAENSPWILGNAAQLENIIINLGVNASHAMKDGGTIKIEVSCLEAMPTGESVSGFKLAAGPYVQIAVRDTGDGIASEHLGKIFEPFFTTKQQDQGTGLGLAAVFGIVTNHHGAITVESVVGVGTCFTMYIPACEPETAQIVKHKEYDPTGGRILIIDDEEMIRDLAAEILSEVGYEVVTAADGKEGLACFDVYQESGSPFDAVLLDMIMPEMDGRECFFELRDRSREVSIVVASGYAEDSSVDDLRKNGLDGYLAKPYRLEDIQRIFADILQ